MIVCTVFVIVVDRELGEREGIYGGGGGHRRSCNGDHHHNGACPNCLGSGLSHYY
jgi:hypothetical protein